MKNIKDISILMISMDTGLLKSSGAGDVIDRHKKYSNNLKRLDIIVFGKSNNKENKLSDNCYVYGVGKNIFSFPKACRLAKRLYKEHNYDLVDTQDPHWTGFLGLRLKQKFNVKLEIHFHGDFWQNNIWLNESWKNKIYNFLQKKVVLAADAIRVVNPRIKDKLINGGILSNKIRVINTPVNEKEFIKEANNEEVAKIQKQYNDKKIIFFVGRLVAAKNLLFLLEVAKLLFRKRDDFVLLIAGKGDEEEKLINFINNNYLDGKIFLLGTKTHQELLNYFKASYLHILLSTNESFGKTIIEAGLAGLTTLASKTLGASFIIQDNSTGHLVDINDLNSTISKLEELLNSPEEVSKLGYNAKKEYLEHYSQETTFNRVNNFWIEIVNEQL